MKKKIVIIGCGECGSTTASILSEKGNYVYIVDKDEEQFSLLENNFSGFMIEKEVNDVPTLENLIDGQIDVLMVVTGNDDTNIFLSIIAKNILNIETVVTRLYDETKKCILSEEDIEVFFPSLLAMEKINAYVNFQGEK